MDKSEYDDIRDAIAERFDDARAETLLTMLDHLYRPRDSALDLAEAVCQLVSAEKRPDGSVVLHGLNSAARLIEANAPRLAEPGDDARELGKRISSVFGVARPEVGGDPGLDPALDAVAELIESALTKAREEERSACAERAKKYIKESYSHKLGVQIIVPEDLIDAIKEAPDEHY